MISARLASLIVLAVGLAASAHAAETVRVTGGAIRGETQGKVTSFKGVPFASPPIGERRWRAPAPVRPWSGVRDASKFGPQCIQVDFAGKHVEQSEDCLTVSVWKPADAQPGAKLPVVVWIYGGAFILGGNAEPAYDGSHVAERGAVVIAPNYRVGKLGFFAHPALTAETAVEAHGNYGFMDVVAALKWVRDNAAKFGGDPRNVTIMGQSAGGMIVNLLMTSPASQGLFQRAMSMSGAFQVPLSPISGPQGAEATGLAFARANGITGTGPEALRALRALPADAIAGQTQLPVTGQSGPMVDGVLIREPPFDAFVAGREAKVPYITGGTNYEASLRASVPPDELVRQLGLDAAQVNAVYGGDPNAARFAATDSMVTQGVRRLVRLHASHGLPAYAYYFAYLPEGQRGRMAGTPHGGDILYFLNHMPDHPFEFYDLAHPAADARDRQLSDTAVRFLLNFARAGDPGTANGVRWAPAEPGDAFMVFGSEGAKLQPHFRQRELDLVGQGQPMRPLPSGSRN